MQRYKRIRASLIIAVLILAVTGCAGGAGEQAGQEGRETDAQTGTEKPADESEGKAAVLCDNYRAFWEAKYNFEDTLIERKAENETMDIYISNALVNEIPLLQYLMPLNFLGESIKTYGAHDNSIEIQMLTASWCDDVSLESTGSAYSVKGRHSHGQMIRVEAEYDADADTLRFEGFKDEELDFVFEYSRIPGGYAAQYYFNDVTRYDKGQPVSQLCVYKSIFSNGSGSCARYEDVLSQPESIFRKVPDAASFIEGADNWFTMSGSGFTGRLSGKNF